MNKELEQWVKDNPKLVRVSRSERYPELRVIKYTNKVFYDNLWSAHPYLIDMRGTVVDEDFNPVIMPFRKIFNQYENDTNFDRDDTVLASKKVNGFMGAVTWNNGKVYFSTTGALDSQYADYVKEIVPQKFIDFLLQKPHWNTAITYLFEIVHPDDPHVVPEEVGAYLLGARTPKWGTNCYYGGATHVEQQLDVIAEDNDLLRPEWKLVRFSDLCKEVKECKHEGYVAYDSGGRALKLKSPYYKIIKLFGRGNVLKKLTSKQWVDEEYYPLCDNIKENIELFTSLTEQEKFDYIRRHLNDE